jgi:hypothetical protein
MNFIVVVCSVMSILIVYEFHRGSVFCHVYFDRVCISVVLSITSPSVDKDISKKGWERSMNSKMKSQDRLEEHTSTLIREFRSTLNRACSRDRQRRCYLREITHVQHISCA